MLRRLLVGSAHYILGPFGKDSDLRRPGEKIASRGAKNAKKRAAVATARKLSVLLHRLWVTAEVYDPLHNAHRRQGGRRQLSHRGDGADKKTEEVKTTGKVATTPKRRMATALTRTHFGSSEVTAPANLAHPPGRPLGRSQHPLSSPKRRIP
jgi:hypothetical protein